MKTMERMTRKALLLFTALAAVLLPSCQDNIDFDYHTIQPLYVVEGGVSNRGAEALVGYTVNMDDTASRNPVDDASVMLTGDDGTSLRLMPQGNGKYCADSSFAGVPGVTYTLTVDVGGNTYSSSSKMPQQIAIDSTWWSWESMLDFDEMCLNFSFDDVKDETSYYYYHVFRNDSSYRRGLIYDLGYENTNIEETLFCMWDGETEDNDPDGWREILYDGDSMRIELRCIDRRTYDYLYSVMLSQSTRSNPLPNFTGGCLGFFSAYTVDEKGDVYYEERVKGLLKK